MTFYYRKFWLTLGWVIILIICYLSLAPTPPDIDMGFQYQDKLKHVFAYFVLMMWFGQLYFSINQRTYIAILFMLMGIFLEVLQGISQERVFEYYDMAANCTGIMIAALLIFKTKTDKILFRLDQRIGQKV